MLQKLLLRLIRQQIPGDSKERAQNESAKQHTKNIKNHIRTWGRKRYPGLVEAVVNYM